MKELAVKRIVIDVDVGTDDYMALLVLFYAEILAQVKIEAILCSNGNASVDDVCKNVVRFLEVIQRTDIPVYKGVSKPIINPKENIPGFHGIDGFGDLKHDKEPDLSIIKDVPSVTALRDIMVNNPKEISLMCVGPLTNFALAIKLYDDLLENIKDVWIMGGNLAAVGNVTASAEYNFYVDPEAAYIVLESVKCPIYLLPWETCLLPNISSEWRFNVLEDKSPALRLLTQAEKSIYTADEKFWLPCDAFVAFAFVNPEKHIKKQSTHHATVELHSSNTRGQVVLDHLKKNKTNVNVIEMIDEELFKEFVLKVANVQ